MQRNILSGYDETKKESWTEASYTAVSSSVPLRLGFSASAFLKGNHGYKSMISKESLPELTADIYINDSFYGSVEIKREYDGATVEEPLVKNVEIDNEESLISDSWNAKSFLGSRGYSTSKSEEQRRNILSNAVKEFGKQRVIDHITFLINIRLSQNNGATKYANAIGKWKEDLAYIRSL